MLAAAATSLPSIRYRTDDLSYDLGLLAAFDAQPVDAAQLERDTEAYLLRTTTERTQLLMKHIFELPVEMDDAGPVAMLPPRSTKLPAAAPPPKPKPLTRWEKFALEKGITKTKRSQKVWDETAGDWKARHGYNVRPKIGVVAPPPHIVTPLLPHPCSAWARATCATGPFP